ncbi:MAG: 5-formyltetrahydrofolate cyclo-ligase [Pseudohongiellaceae bacterium]
MSSFPDLKSLRKQSRQKRRKLTPYQQRRAALELFHRVRRQPWFRFSRNLSFYQAGDGEIDPTLLFRLACKRGKKCYLPVMSRLGPARLRFIRYRPGDRLRRRQMHVLEPRIRIRNLLQPWALRLVLMPLVVFDANCNRVGMGKGYYDRTFAFKKRGKRKRPVLLGLAHECQRVEKLQPAPWDVQLDAIATPVRIYQAGP